MGASVSTNTTSILTTATTKVVDDVTQEAHRNGSQDFVISAHRVDGTVNIHDLTINQSTKEHFISAIANLSKEENNEKFKAEIAQAAKSLINGLNLANVSVSTSYVNNVIKNCIEIVNKNAANCEVKDSQKIGVDFEDIKGDLNITNFTVNQVIDSFVACLLSSANVTSFKNEIDNNIKQISSTKTEGLDLKWIAIAAAMGITGVSFAGSKVLSSMMGPGMILAGAGLTYYSIHSQKNPGAVYKNDYVYILKDLVDYMNSNDLVSINAIKPVEKIPDDPTIYKYQGKPADVYVFFDKIVALYNILNYDDFMKTFKDLNQNIFNRDNMEFNITADKELVLNMKNTNKYASVKILSGLTDPNVKINVLPKREINKDQTYSTDPSTIDLEISDINYTHTIIMYKQGRHFGEYHLKPTLVSYKTQEETTEYYKKPMFLVGIGLIAVGLLITLMSHSKGGKNK